MKFFVVLCSFVLVTLSLTAPPDAKHMEMLKIILKECATIEGGSESDIEKMLVGDFPETETGHCMMSCVNEKIGVVRNPKP